MEKKMECAPAIGDERGSSPSGSKFQLESRRDSVTAMNSCAGKELELERQGRSHSQILICLC